MKVLVTGCAGFIGWRVSEFLLEMGESVLGLDNLNYAYDPVLKRWRLSKLQEYDGFEFIQMDIIR